MILFLAGVWRMGIYENSALESAFEYTQFTCTKQIIISPKTFAFD